MKVPVEETLVEAADKTGEDIVVTVFGPHTPEDKSTRVPSTEKEDQPKVKT